MTENRNRDKCILKSGIQLHPNFKEEVFPDRMSEEKRVLFDRELAKMILDMEEFAPYELRFEWVDGSKRIREKAFMDRGVVPVSFLSADIPYGLFLSPDENLSIVLGGKDHLWLQMSCVGENLKGLWEKADALDDAIHQKKSYAFCRNFGFLSADDSYLGTGMNAYYILYLPYLDHSKSLSSLVDRLDEGSFRLSPLFMDKKVNVLFLLSFTKTMGIREEDVPAVMQEAAALCIEQNEKERMLIRETEKGRRREECLKTYNMLQSSEALTEQDAIQVLKLLWLGYWENEIEFFREPDFYEMMISISDEVLMMKYSLNNKNQMLNILRAKEVREKLTALKMIETV